MELNVEKLTNAEQNFVKDLDPEGLSAAKLCLLSIGALAGLSVRGPLARRLLGLGCTILAAGLAIPLAVKKFQEAEEPVEDAQVETVEEAQEAEAPVEEAVEAEAPVEEAEAPVEEVVEAQAPAEETETPAEKTEAPVEETQEEA